MKLLIIAAVCVASAIARPDVAHILKPTSNDRDAEILEQTADINPDGSYRWSYKSANGIDNNAMGHIEVLGPEQTAQVSHGGHAYTAPNGEQISLTYAADQNGYQPQGSHIPTPPPIPEYILRSLEYIRSHPPPQEPARRF